MNIVPDYVQEYVNSRLDRSGKLIWHRHRRKTA